MEHRFQSPNPVDEAGPPSTAAQEHSAARADSEFSVAEMLSELRALRASVIRLWMKQQCNIAVAELGRSAAQTK